MRLWQKVRPVFGLSRTEVSFDADDLMLFVAAKNFDYVMNLLEFALRCAVLTEIQREYNERREKMTNVLADLGPQMDGDLGAIHLSPADRARLEPRSVDLESLVTQLRTFLAEDSTGGLALAAQFGPNVRAAMPGFEFPNLSVPGQPSKQPLAANT